MSASSDSSDGSDISAELDVSARSDTSAEFQVSDVSDKLPCTEQSSRPCRRRRAPQRFGWD